MVGLGFRRPHVALAEKSWRTEYILTLNKREGRLYSTGVPKASTGLYCILKVVSPSKGCTRTGCSVGSGVLKTVDLVGAWRCRLGGEQVTVFSAMLDGGEAQRADKAISQKTLTSYNWLETAHMCPRLQQSHCTALVRQKT